MSFFQKVNSIPFHLNPLTEVLESKLWLHDTYLLVTVLDYWSTFWFIEEPNFLSHISFSIIKTRNCRIRYRMYNGSLIFKNEIKMKSFTTIPHHIKWNLQSIILLWIIFLQVLFIYCGPYKLDISTILPQLLSSCVHHSFSAVPLETKDWGFITLCKAPAIWQNP